MKLTDAAQLLGLSGDITPEEVNRAYRQAALHYHPDRNPAGDEMMKLINAADDVLKDYTGTLGTGVAETSHHPYPEAVNAALNVIIGLTGLEIEICSAWVWVGGNTYPQREIRKPAGFKFVGQKNRWYFRPDDWRSLSRGGYSMDDIRSRYGSVHPTLRRDLLPDEETV